jgi:UDP-GlcNAc:undecaprenyl-phosphate GlcNAc-1-phosphate transferase
VAYYTAYFLRFEGSIGKDLHMFLNSLPVVIACQILSFYIMGIYRGVWESTGLRDLIGYIKAVTVGTVLPILILLAIYRFQSFSRAVFAIYWFLMLVLISLSRLSFRLLDEGIRKGNRNGKPALIYGAGVGGQMTMKEIETNRDLGLVLVGFVDDNPRILGRKIKGYSVLGGHKDLNEIIKKYKIKEVIISFKENGLEKKKEIRSLCVNMGAEVEIKQMQLILS